MSPRALAVAVPALLAVAASCVAASIFWRGGALTLSEAAALRDQGEVVRQIAAGANPNATYPLRHDVLSIPSATPLEAAIGARRAEMVELLMLHGATADAATWRRLHCFALRTEAADVVEMLDRYKPASAETSCEGISTPF